MAREGKRWRWGLVLLLGCAAAAQAKLPEVRVAAHAYVLPPLLIRAQSSLVDIEVVVRSPDGALVSGLGKDNFLVYDNGVRRTDLEFSVATAPGAPARRDGGAGAAPAPTATPAPAGQRAPRSIAFYFDDVNTANGDLTEARNAAARFVKEQLGPADRAALFTASSEQSLGLTADRQKLLAAIAAIRSHPRAGDSQLTCPRITAYQAYLITVVHDPMALGAAVAEAGVCPGAQPVDEMTGRVMPGLQDRDSHEPVLAQAESTWDQAEGISYDTLHALGGVVNFLGQQAGSRMLLMTSGGFLDGSGTLQQQEDDIIQAALRHGVVINSLDAKGLYTDGPGRPLNEATDVGTLPLSTFLFEETSKHTMRQEQDAAMMQLARSTGGLFFHDNNDLTLGFERLGMIPAVTYQLAFDPGDIPHDGKYRKLKVALAPHSKDLLQYRPGYFAPGAEGGATAADQIAAAMRGAQDEVGVAAQVESRPGAEGVQVAVRLDAARLPFRSEKGREREDLLVTAGLFDPRGELVQAKQGEMDLALKGPTWKKMQAQGLSLNLSLRAKPGTYRLRVVVRESNRGGIFAGSESVAIR